MPNFNPKTLFFLSIEMGARICYTKDTEREVDSNVPLSTLKFFKARKVNYSGLKETAKEEFKRSLGAE